jgi:hypothetical protein
MNENESMPGHTCYHCKQWVEEGEAHDCWTTTEEALTRGLSEDLREAWERLRETAATLGDQRIYASHHSIMFSRKACYFFVRPKRAFLEVCVFLGRTLKDPMVRKVHPSGKVKAAHMMRIEHRDQVERPFTDWIREAYEFAGQAAVKGAAAAVKKGAKKLAKTTATRGRVKVVKKRAVKKRATKKATRLVRS